MLRDFRHPNSDECYPFISNRFGDHSRACLWHFDAGPRRELFVAAERSANLSAEYFELLWWARRFHVGSVVIVEPAIAEHRRFRRRHSRRASTDSEPRTNFRPQR